ncbi:hypothetical protein KA344_16280 [bacterium]|jgi:thioredoxin 1|nr:hypothetical protein [bacterium]
MHDPIMTCPNCDRKDKTSFSKCRFCHTRYDAIIEKEKFTIDSRLLGIVAFVVVFGSAGLWVDYAYKQQKIKSLAPIVASIKAANKPRIIEFYATWCPPCKEYEPVIEACRVKYLGRVDFERLNVDDKANLEKKQALDVKAIPKTCFFDNEGNQVEEVVGGLDQDKLEIKIGKLLLPK